MLFCFVLFDVDQKLPTIQYSLRSRMGYGIIQVVCCVVSSFNYHLVVCSLQLQAERCQAIQSEVFLTQSSFGSSIVEIDTTKKLLSVDEFNRSELVAGNFGFSC